MILKNYILIHQFIYSLQLYNNGLAVLHSYQTFG